MSANPNTLATDKAIDRSGGLMWQRLHSEREDVCEALLKEFRPSSEAPSEAEEMSKEDAVSAATWRRELLQARLQKIDDALDRLMSGSYGNCCKCGRWIEDTKLDFDPAIAFCIECWQRQQSQTHNGSLIGDQREPKKVATSDLLDNLIKISPLLPGVALESLTPFDTIWIRTHNSDYRIFLLDPRSGRAIVEGGRHFVEPVEAILNGSTFGGSTIKPGWIGVGLRIEMWVNDKLVSTSPVQSIRVEHNISGEPALAAIPNWEM